MSKTFKFSYHLFKVRTSSKTTCCLDKDIRAYKSYKRYIDIRNAICRCTSLACFYCWSSPAWTHLHVSQFKRYPQFVIVSNIGQLFRTSEISFCVKEKNIFRDQCSTQCNKNAVIFLFLIPTVNRRQTRAMKSENSATDLSQRCMPYWENWSLRFVDNFRFGMLNFAGCSYKNLFTCSSTTKHGYKEHVYKNVFQICNFFHN